MSRAAAGSAVAVTGASAGSTRRTRKDRVDYNPLARTMDGDVNTASHWADAPRVMGVMYYYAHTSLIEIARDDHKDAGKSPSADDIAQAIRKMATYKDRSEFPSELRPPSPPRAQTSASTAAGGKDEPIGLGLGINLSLNPDLDSDDDLMGAVDEDCARNERPKGKTKRKTPALTPADRAVKASNTAVAAAARSRR